jgi:hypothetical protein
MKTKTFDTFDEASQYEIATHPKHSRHEVVNGKAERILTLQDGTQEKVVSPLSDRTLDESIARVKSMIEAMNNE